MKKTARKPMILTTEDGRQIVHVPLPNHPTPAVVYLEDFEKCLALGISDQWLVNHVRHYSYVRAHLSTVCGSLTTLARHIVDARRGEIVRYLDGDPTNLLQENLYVERGYAKGASPALEDWAKLCPDSLRDGSKVHLVHGTLE